MLYPRLSDTIDSVQTENENRNSKGYNRKPTLFESSNNPSYLNILIVTYQNHCEGADVSCLPTRFQIFFDFQV